MLGFVKFYAIDLFRCVFGNGRFHRVDLFWSSCDTFSVWRGFCWRTPREPTHFLNCTSPLPWTLDTAVFFDVRKLPMKLLGKKNNIPLPPYSQRLSHVIVAKSNLAIRHFPAKGDFLQLCLRVFSHPCLASLESRTS